MKVLCVEDYAPLRKSIQKGLTEAGYAVDVAEDGEEGLWLAETAEYDVILLDLMLPKIDGSTILARLRESGNQAAVLILTAKDTVPDRVAGLSQGADDYLTKPFAFEELLARVAALVRRKFESRSPIIRIADMDIDTSARLVTRSGQSIDLTAREYAILEVLAYHAGKIVTRSEIWDHIADFASESNSNIIDVYVGHLRKKLETGGKTRLIQTRRGIGYRLGESE